jgi:exodeoxyribonuclease VII small subunit
VAELKYQKAMEKLEEIIARIENEDIDVDELSQKVREAADLIQLCKARIDKAEMDVRKVVKDFEKGGGLPDDGDAQPQRSE